MQREVWVVSSIWAFPEIMSVQIVARNFNIGLLFTIKHLFRRCGDDFRSMRKYLGKMSHKEQPPKAAREPRVLGGAFADTA